MSDAPASASSIQRIRHGLIQFAGTKSGRVRNVPINEGLEAELKLHHAPAETGPRVFEYACSAFRDAVDRIGLPLPEGQLTHVLRHTFASHFTVNGGSILTLQKILGHANLTMAMRYAHLAPEHLHEARALNPLVELADPHN